MADGSDVDYEYEVNQSRVRASKRRYAEQRRGARAGTQVEGDGSDGSAGQFEKEMMGEDFTMREIEDSLDRTIRHTEEMHRAGAETAATLHRQGDQLRVAVEDLADQEEHMNRAQYYLSLLEQSCCWQLFCCCCCCCEPEYKRGRLIRRGGRGRDEDPLGEPLIAEIRMEGKKKGKQSVARARAKRGVERPASEEDRHSLKVDRVYELTEEEKFDRLVDDKLDRIGGALNKLGDLAGDMGAELKYQSDVLIPEIDQRAQSSKDTTKDLNKRANRLVR